MLIGFDFLEELPSLVSLPNLTSNQTAADPKISSDETTILSKLTELMGKISQKQSESTLKSEKMQLVLLF